jgi:hypothetical protein
MEKFKFSLELVVEIEAFDLDDAGTVISDYFGKGDLDGIVTIKKCVIK